MSHGLINITKGIVQLSLKAINAIIIEHSRVSIIIHTQTVCEAAGGAILSNRGEIIENRVALCQSYGSLVLKP